MLPDRRVETSAPKKITPWIVYNHDNRRGAYSSMKWKAEHFSGTDWDQRGEKHAIFKIIDDPANFPKPGNEDPDLFKKGMHRISKFFSGKKSDAKSTIAMQRPGKGWAEDVDDLHGNADYLMFSDIDHKHPEVREDLFRWADWMVHENELDGFRLDAAAHFSYGFARDWIARAHEASRAKRGRDAFIVGEVWTGKVAKITRWLDTVGQGAYAYDSPLVYDLARVAKDVVAGSPNADLRTIARDSLVKERPNSALTLVTNHDTQPGQTSDTPIDPRLKAVFYAFILLRAEGLPSVFWGDLYGTSGKEGTPPTCMASSSRSLLPDLVFSRRMYAYGQQTDYFDAQSCIGWTRSGTHDRPGCAVVISVGPQKEWSNKKMQVGRPGEVWVDVLSDPRQRVEVQIDQSGVGNFYCLGWSPAVYVRKDVPGLDHFPVNHDLNCYQQ
jgi:alpha-amylase